MGKQNAKGSYEVRPIDSCAAAGVNLGIGAVENLQMEGLKTLLAMAKAIAEVFEHDPVFRPIMAKGDHRKAFKQWPVYPAGRHAVVSVVWHEEIGPHGVFYACDHVAFPFGLVASVWHCTKISQGICAIPRVLFGAPQVAYVDDFLRMVPAKFAWIVDGIFVRLHKLF